MMNAKSHGLSIEVIDSEEAFLAIKDDWDKLIDKDVNSSFYSTFPFVYTAWKYFRNENNRLFILLVRRDKTLVGIAPFRIEREWVGNIYFLKKIRFIAEWGGGDKPSIVKTEEPALIWERIFQFLSKEFTQWDGIWLVEQPVNSPLLNQKFLNNKSYSILAVPNDTSFYISITGTWEEYLETRGKNTHSAWRRYRKKLYEYPEEVVFQCVNDPEFIPEALKKFIRIEQSGWKKDRDFSVGGSEKNKRFYEELLVQLAYKNMASIYLLTSGTTDIAGMILYKHNSSVYMAQITYNPAYAKYSPGVILNVEIIKTLFGTHYQEYDFLVFQRGDEKNSYKKKWSTGSRQTITIFVNKRNFRMLFYYKRNQLKTLLRLVKGILTGHKASEQA